MDPIAQASLDRVLAAVEAERALSEDLREHAKALERAQRKVCVQLGQVHALPLSHVPAHLDVAAASMADVREALAQLAAQVPAHEFYRVRTYGLCSGVTYGPAPCAMPRTPPCLPSTSARAASCPKRARNVC